MANSYRLPLFKLLNPVFETWFLYIFRVFCDRTCSRVYICCCIPLKTFPTGYRGRWNCTAHVLPSPEVGAIPCSSFLSLSLSLFFFSLRFSPRSNVENAASPKPLPLPSKSPKIKSNPTLLFYSALSLHSPSSSRCQNCSTLPNAQKREYGLNLSAFVPLLFLDLSSRVCACVVRVSQLSVSLPPRMSPIRPRGGWGW